MPSLFETSVLTSSCVRNCIYCFCTHCACVFYLSLNFISLISRGLYLHSVWIPTITLDSHEALWSVVGGLSEKKEKKSKPLFWASVINSLFCVRINIFTVLLTLCIFVYLFFTLLSLRFFATLKRSQVTRTTCDWPDNSRGNLHEYLFHRHP